MIGRLIDRNFKGGLHQTLGMVYNSIKAVADQDGKFDLRDVYKDLKLGETIVSPALSLLIDQNVIEHISGSAECDHTVATRITEHDSWDLTGMRYWLDNNSFLSDSGEDLRELQFCKRCPVCHDDISSLTSELKKEYFNQLVTGLKAFTPDRARNFIESGGFMNMGELKYSFHGKHGTSKGSSLFSEGLNEGEVLEILNFWKRLPGNNSFADTIRFLAKL